MTIQKRCRHVRGLTGRARTKAARECGCTWGIYPWVDGTRTWIALGPDEQHARVQALRMQADLLDGRRPRRAPGQGVDDILDAWYAHRVVDGARVASLHAYRSHIKRIKQYMADSPVGALRTEHVARFAAALREAGLEPRTVNGILSTLSGALRYATGQGVNVGDVDFKSAYQKPVDGKPWLMTVEECRRLIAAAHPPWNSMMEVALLTGLRRGELMAIKVTDIDLHRGLIHVRDNLNVERGTNPPKSRHSIRVVRMTDRCRDVIAARVGEVGAGVLWPGTLHDATNAIRRTMMAANLYREKRGWHCFRDAHTALLNEAGVSLRDAAARLGHGPNTAQTMSYGWADEQVDVNVIDATVDRHA